MRAISKYLKFMLIPLVLVVGLLAHPSVAQAAGTASVRDLHGRSYSVGNTVGAWQATLWADGYIVKCGSRGVDGRYGATSITATKKWQAAHRLSADGTVGAMTWAAMRAHLRPLGMGTYYYKGRYHNFEVYVHGVHVYFAAPAARVRMPYPGLPLSEYLTKGYGTTRLTFHRC